VGGGTAGNAVDLGGEALEAVKVLRFIASPFEKGGLRGFLKK